MPANKQTGSNKQRGPKTASEIAEELVSAISNLEFCNRTLRQDINCCRSDRDNAIKAKLDWEHKYWSLYNKMKPIGRLMYHLNISKADEAKCKEKLKLIRQLLTEYDKEAKQEDYRMLSD